MIQSVQRAAQVLDVLGSGTPRLGVTEIADRLGLAKPTVHGLLRTLEAYGLVAQDQATGKYSLGPGVLQLGNAYLDGSDLRARSLRWAEGLALQAKEAVWVATLSGGRVIVLHHVFRPDNTVQILEVGAAIPWHACALGHAIVAYLPAGQRAQALGAALSPLTGRTKTTRAALTRALAQVRGAGYAVENEEATVGDAGIAAPILGRDDLVAGAVGVVGSAERLLAPGTRNDLVRAVVAAARAISRDLGRRPGRRRRPVLADLAARSRRCPSRGNPAAPRGQPGAEIRASAPGQPPALPLLGPPLVPRPQVVLRH